LGNTHKPHQVSYSHRPAGSKLHAYHTVRSNGNHGHSGIRSVTYHSHTMRNHRLHELIAACAARGLDPRVVREALEMATDKGVRKLTQSLSF